MFKKRENVLEIEEGNLLSPKFDNDGLIPVITMCSKTKDVLMHGYMNVEALKKTIETKEAHYFSRSRKAIWHKGKNKIYTLHDNLHHHLYQQSSKQSLDHHQFLILLLFE